VIAKVGDRVVVEAERTTQTPRQGVIEEVLRDQPLRCRVQWDDGHESILSPAAGALHVEPARRAKRARAAKR
jgi:putative ribosome biogenesis GTPase RsgA